MSQRPDRRDNTNRLPWFPILLLVIGVSIGGSGLLGCAAQRLTVAVATQAPPVTATSPSPTHTATIPPTATMAQTPTSPPAPVPTATAGPQALTHITIVHTNDTWGYTLPCG